MGEYVPIVRRLVPGAHEQGYIDTGWLKPGMTWSELLANKEAKYRHVVLISPSRHGKE